MTALNVLIVDDKPENLLAMESTLAGLGPNLEFATSARQALRYLLTEEVALILLDVQMPGVNGFELAELIRQREQTQNTPIIFISATSVEEQFIFKGYSLGAVDYLTKPFEPKILRSKVSFFTALYEKNSEIRRQAKLLEEANSRLDELNDDLEIRVQQRTSELETANQELQAEISIRKKSESRLALEHTVTRELAGADSFKNAVPQILKAFCTYLGADVSALWLPNETASSLHCSHIEYSGSSSEIDRFVMETRKSSFAKGAGLSGSVWEAKVPVWETDLSRELRYPAIFSVSIGIPIKIGDEVLAVLEFCSRSAIVEEVPLLNMFEAIGNEIGQFVHRKQLEAERENLLLQEMSLRQQAEKASRLKDEFLATVSHELRTPLNSILGWGQILNTGALTGSKLQNALDIIYRNAKAQSQLINDLLDMSRLITGNLPLDLGPTAVRTIIEAAIDIVRPHAATKSISIVTDFRSDVPDITCDAERLQQMIWNLLINAIKFTPNDGTVEVILSRTDHDVEIAVRDNGQGIDPDFLPHVFDRFRQGDSSSTREHGGLGLGLAIVTNLTERLGGHVTVASEGLGHGSAFTIYLPLTIVESASKTNLSPSSAQSNGNAQTNSDAKDLEGIRLLIVDDDDDANNMLSFALRSYGAEIRTSSSVASALDAIVEWKPNVLLTDINMPGEDGYALIRQLRNMPVEECSRIPAIALTAMARPEDGDLAVSSGFQLHIPKPVDILDLTTAIVSLVQQPAN